MCKRACVRVFLHLLTTLKLLQMAWGTFFPAVSLSEAGDSVQLFAAPAELNVPHLSLPLLQEVSQAAELLQALQQRRLPKSYAKEIDAIAVEHRTVKIVTSDRVDLTQEINIPDAMSLSLFFSGDTKLRASDKVILTVTGADGADSSLTIPGNVIRSTTKSMVAKPKPSPKAKLMNARER